MGRIGKWIIAILILMIGGALFLIQVPKKWDTDPCVDQYTTGGEAFSVASDASFSPSGLTVKGGKLEDESVKIVVEAAAVIASRKDVPAQYRELVTTTIISTGIVESELVNVDHGDRDSGGWLQQRPSQGWGTYEQVRQVKHATNKFVDALVAQPGWKNAKTREQKGDLAQDVQRSGHPERYAEQMHEAEAIYQRMTNNSPVQPVSAECAEMTATETKIDVALEAARKLVGTKPTSTVKNGAELVNVVMDKAGIPVSKTAEEIATYKGDEKAGVEGAWHPVADILSGEVTPKPGDIVCYSTVANPTREDCETVGLYETSSSSINGFTLVTYNVRGASHTDNGRSRELHSSERTKMMVRVLNDPSYPMDVIGLQEFEGKQWKQFHTATSDFGIYPPKPVYNRKGGRTSVNSILWRKSRFDFVSGGTRPFLYFKGNENHIPIVKLRDKTTGGVFYVYNGHDPADVHGPAGKYRIEDAKRHVSTFRELTQEGVPVFKTGDENSTINEQPHKIMMASGLVRDAYEAAQARGKRARIDRIYATPDARLNDYRVVSTKDAQLSTDHLPVGVRVEVGTPGNTSPTKASELGYYIGLSPKTGKFDRLPMVTANLVGLLRLTISQPEMAVADGEWTLPIDPPYRLTAAFGQGGSMWSANHTGQDFAADTGTPIHAAASGEIVLAEMAGSYGLKVEIRLSDGTEIWYCHLSKFALKSGQVRAGDIIGEVGETGNTTGPHLHIEVRDKDGNPTDPMAALRKHGLDP